ncbi:hypothetical protein [Plastoroseomonas arctica]|uniref:Uncharacterized protein n=1 Tax=Plastoroseomonas arctica TaxID=1509237 RepID=A0AAF1JY08_9PROT|nr:hypothetical protein [Plastoroseomonas arctica]MBR0656524.1 hypothetical protein [Plastoroseomonas arctica]
MLAVFLLLTLPALAQVLFPAGSPLGLAPPPGYFPALAFAGFANAGSGARILLAEQPAMSFAVARALVAPQRQGLTEAVVREVRAGGREAVLVRGRRGESAVWLLAAPGADVTALVTVMVPRVPVAPGEVAAIEASLLTLAVRPVDLAAARAALPFAFDEVAPLRFRQSVGGAAAVLLPDEVGLDDAAAPRLTIATSLAATPPPADRRRAAEAALVGTLPGVRLEGGGTLRLGATEAVVLEGRLGARRVRQWVLFFERGGTLRVLAEAPATEFARLLPAFERVVESIRRP